MKVTLVQKIKRTIVFELEEEDIEALGYASAQEMKDDLVGTEPHVIVELLKGAGLDPEVTDNSYLQWYSPSDDIYLDKIEEE